MPSSGKPSSHRVAVAEGRIEMQPGTLALMERAMAAGADWVGSLDPYAIDRDPAGHLDAIFGLAEKFARVGYEAT